MFDETLKTVAEALVAGCREGREREGLETLYAEDAISIEAADTNPQMGRIARGRAAIQAKHDWWDSSTQVHSFSADGPYLHGDDRFGVIFEADITMTGTGERWQMKELAVYTVVNGKITREEFYFAT